MIVVVEGGRRTLTRNRAMYLLWLFLAVTWMTQKRAVLIAVWTQHKHANGVSRSPSAATWQRVFGRAAMQRISLSCVLGSSLAIQHAFRRSQRRAQLPAKRVPTSALSTMAIISRRASKPALSAPKHAAIWRRLLNPVPRIITLHYRRLPDVTSIYIRLLTNTAFSIRRIEQYEHAGRGSLRIKQSRGLNQYRLERERSGILIIPVLVAPSSRRSQASSDTLISCGRPAL